MNHIINAAITTSYRHTGLASLKKRYPASYARLKPKKMGQESFYE